MKKLRENLLVQFSVVSFLVMAAIAVVLAIILANKIRTDAVNALVNEAIGASSDRLLRVIKPSDLEVAMTGERYKRFHQFVEEQIVSKRTARIKIWAQDGTVVYDNDPAKVGQRFPSKEGLLAALRGQNFTELKIPQDAEHQGEKHLDTLMEVYTPIVFPGTTEPQGAFEFYQYFAPTAELIYDLRGRVFSTTGVGFLFLYASLVSIVWRGWRTIVRQRNQLQSFNAELEKRVQQRTAELREAQDKLVRTERLAAIGELSAGVAHELRNPLGAIKNAAYYIKGKLRDSNLVRDNPRVGDFLGIMDEEIETSNRIITELMDFSRVNPPNLSPTTVDTVVDNALSRIQIKEDVKIVKDLEPGLPEVLADSEQLRRAFTNLFKNAEEAMPEGGTLTISAKAKDDHVELQFRDTGQGIPDTNLSTVFDPLFTTKPRGIGLGLAIVKQIIERHRGGLGVESKLGKGATFTIRLPLNVEQRPDSSQTWEKSHGQ